MHLNSKFTSPYLRTGIINNAALYEIYLGFIIQYEMLRWLRIGGAPPDAIGIEFNLQ